MARKPKNITFETKRSGQKENFKKALIFLALLAALAAVLVGVAEMFGEDSDFSLSGEEGGTTQGVSEQSTVSRSVKMNENFLIWSEDEDKKKIDFMWLVNLKMPEREVRLTQIDPNQVYEGESFDSVFQRQGETALKTAVENAFETEIARFAFSDKSGFKTMISYFDGVDIYIPEQIEYKSEEMTLILVKGQQNMKGDTFYKYLTYLGTLGEEGKAKKDEAFYAMLDCILCPANLSRRSRIYSKISNTITTDITIMDFSKAESAVMLLMENGVEIPESEEQSAVNYEFIF